MRKYRSIQNKLTLSVTLLITSIFLVLLLVILSIEIDRTNVMIKNSKNEMKERLIIKGKSIANNINLITARVISSNRQLLTIKSTITEFFINDKDISYIIYMDTNHLTLVHISQSFPQGVLPINSPLDDSLSIWASKQSDAANSENVFKNHDFIEFVSPVIVDKKRIGVIRLGISCKSMNHDIEQVIQSGRKVIFQDMFIIIILCILSISISFLIIKRIARHFTRPIDSLVKSTHLIAEGNYDIAVTAESNDEIGTLAVDFERMKNTIRNYTDHLQVVINEKLLQVTDILNNINQGLFTINLDCAVNKEYSTRANQILKITDIASSNLQEILRMDDRQNAAFLKWIELVRKTHKQIRWNKLARLAPVQELELQDDKNSQDISFVSISYQCIFDTNRVLSKIMILALDVTEKRLKDLHMASERQRHENDVKALLCIANSTAEEITEFMDDTSSRLEELSTQVAAHIDGVTKQRNEHPFGLEYTISPESFDNMYRDLHTIKGNSGSYGFDLLAAIAHQAESQLEKFRQTVSVRRSEDLRVLNELFFKMKSALDEIHQKIKLIFGEEEELTCRIPEYHIANILNTCDSISKEPLSPDIQSLVGECRMLAWKPLRILLRKYEKNALKIARKLHKNIEIVIKNEKQFFNPLLFTGMDEILIHLIRNSVDHGIENTEIRDELGKGPGKILIELDIIDEFCFLAVSDDGRGIDIEKLLSNAIQKKFITAEQAIRMTNDEKIALIFKGGLTTVSEITELSGRGMGLDIVQHKVKGLGGTITTNTIFGQGTAFCIKIPVRNLAG